MFNATFDVSKMSDSEAEFESADEGSNDGNGWDVESDFDLPSVESSNPSETKINSFPNIHDTVDTERNVKCKEENVKPSGQNKLDDTPALESKFEKLTVINETTNSGCVPEVNKVVQNELKSNSTQSSSWGGWSTGWSVNSLISTASALTNQVSQGITNVIGAPTPEQLASVETVEGKSPESVLGTNYFLNNVSQITKIVETTGSKIINGGLDTLETVGKKTLEVLQEGDPGLRKKRALFFQNTEKINLSQVLQEAKEKENAEFECKQNNQVELKKGYAFLLDSYQGLVHLESLELLSKQSQMKLQTVLLSCSGIQLTNIQDKLQNLKELCYFDCDDDDKQFDNKEFKTSLVSCINQISVDVKTEKILRVSDSINEKLKGAFDCEDNIHDEGISALAELTAAAMELYYKLGEMLMINIDNHLATVKAENLTLLNEAVCCRMRSIANEYACLLTKFEADNTSNLISDIYLESSNSSSYIQDAAQLLIPILQLSII